MGRFLKHYPNPPNAPIAENVIFSSTTYLIYIDMDRRLLNIKELSEYIGYSPTSIRRMIARRQIPFVYAPGGSYRFDVRRIDRWIEEYSMKAEMDLR